MGGGRNLTHVEVPVLSDVGFDPCRSRSASVSDFGKKGECINPSLEGRVGWRLLRADLTKEGAIHDWTPVDEAFQVMHQPGAACWILTEHHGTRRRTDSGRGVHYRPRAIMSRGGREVNEMGGDGLSAL